MDTSKANMLGSIIALSILVICCLIFIFRLLGFEKTEYWLGVLFLLTALPLAYLMLTANQHSRPSIYYIQIGFFLVFTFVELLLDYILKFDFRSIKWMAISYAMLFFAATGGMIGVASLSGKSYSIASIALFFIMAFLAFFQRAKTGM